MITILYDTQAQKVAHRIQGEYLVDGQPGRVDLPMIKLVEVRSTPTYDPATQKAVSAWVVDEVAGEYRQEWTVTDKTVEELKALVQLGILSVNRTTIPADGLTKATITYTSETPVTFIASTGEIVAKEPVMNVATFTLAANAPGIITVQIAGIERVVTITATEVV